MPIQFEPIPRGAIRIPLPDVRQDTNATCGAASLQAICLYYGVGPVEEEDIAKDMRMNLRLGSDPSHIQRAAEKYGLNFNEERGMSNHTLKKHIQK